MSLAALFRSASVLSACFVAFLLALLASGCAGTPGIPKTEKPKLERITASYSTPSGSYAPVWIAKEAGIFEKYGLDVTLQYVQAGSTLVGALSTGDVLVATAGGPDIVAPAVEGADVALIGVHGNLLNLSIYAVPSINKVEDLRGKNIGISKFGSATDYIARLVLRKYGLEPEKDVGIVQSGGVAETVTMMSAGKVQAGALSLPNTLNAKKLGFKELVDGSQLGEDSYFPSAAIGTSRTSIKQHGDQLERYLKAIIEAMQRAKIDKAFFKKMVGQYTKTDDDEVLEGTYQYFEDKWAKDAFPVAKGVEVVLGQLAAGSAKAKSAKVEEIWDLSILEKVKASGLVEKLYGGK